jgi:hypothetical protein
MTLNASGPISLAGTTAGQSIEIENGGNGTTQISLNDSAVRSLAGVPSGAITMPTNFYGKSNRVVQTITLSSSAANYTFNPAKISGYVAGKTCATLTINSGVYVYSTSTGSAGLSVSGWTSGDVVKVNNRGVIAGQGGNGGNGACAAQGAPAPTGGGGGSGGTALSVSYATTICNSGGTVAGGGGGGGGGGATITQIQSGYCCCQSVYIYARVGGSGGGGGRTGLNGTSGGSGGPGGCNYYQHGNPGGGGSSSGAGGGGGGTNCRSGNPFWVCTFGAAGGGGGGWGSGGSNGGTGYQAATSAPTLRNNSSNSGGGGGGGAGPATSGNGNITWSNTGNRYGPLN